MAPKLKILNSTFRPEPPPYTPPFRNISSTPQTQEPVEPPPPYFAFVNELIPENTDESTASESTPEPPSLSESEGNLTVTQTVAEGTRITTPIEEHESRLDRNNSTEEQDVGEIARYTGGQHVRSEISYQVDTTIEETEEIQPTLEKLLRFQLRQSTRNDRADFE